MLSRMSDLVDHLGEFRMPEPGRFRMPGPPPGVPGP
jgi:hypothetical protein